MTTFFVSVEHFIANMWAVEASSDRVFLRIVKAGYDERSHKVKKQVFHFNKETVGDWTFDIECCFKSTPNWYDSMSEAMAGENEGWEAVWQSDR